MHFLFSPSILLRMAPKKQAKKGQAGISKAVDKPPRSFPIIFPEIAEKEGLQCSTLLEDQIIIVDVRCPLFTVLERSNKQQSCCQGFMSPLECKEYVKFIDSLPLELTPPKKRGEAERVNRALVCDATSLGI